MSTPAPTRVLLLLGQSPFDPASGAARSMRTICEFLADAGMTVVALATTATEQGGDDDPLHHLTRALPGLEIDRSAPVLRFTSKGIAYALVQTSRLDEPEPKHAARFDALFDEILDTFRPHILFTYGGQPPDFARRRRARQRGAAVVFGLRNLSYLHPHAFPDVDAILTGSQFLTDHYRRLIGIDSTPLPLPLDPADVIAPAHERVFITYINPSIEKGVMFAARLAEELGRRRPDIPMLTVESRGTSGQLVAAGLLGGFDLRRHENLMFSPAVPRPADIYALARVVIAPSVWEEPAGRVAAEALLNGIPPIVSDRGGLAEVSANGGFVLPLPPDLTLDSRTPVSAEAVQPWLNILIRLADDAKFYEIACTCARAAGQAYSPAKTAPRYVEFFNRLRPHQ